MSIIYWDTTTGYIHERQHQHQHSLRERYHLKIQNERHRFGIHAITGWSLAAFGYTSTSTSTSTAELRVEPDGIRIALVAYYSNT